MRLSNACASPVNCKGFFFFLAKNTDVRLLQRIELLFESKDDITTWFIISKNNLQSKKCCMNKR